MARLRRVLHPSDFSPASRRAFRTAIDLVKALRGDLVLVHVLWPVIPPVMSAERYVPPVTYALERTARALAQRHLDRLVAHATRAGVRVSSRLVEGVPVSDRLVRAATAVHADLIVMGTHGWTGVSRFVLGSVAARVVATASCPVLTVRGR